MFAKLISLIFFSLLCLSPAFSEEQKHEGMVITVNGVINPVSSEFIGKSIKKANEKKIEALIIELDTPGDALAEKLFHEA